MSSAAPQSRWWQKLIRDPSWLWSLAARLFRRKRERPCDVLIRHADQLWDTAPFEALELVRGVYEKVTASGGGLSAWKPSARLSDLLRSIDVAPFGRFTPFDTLDLYLFLYHHEFALGRYEEAMQISTSLPTQVDRTILQQVDCLTAMGRYDDAVAHLEKHLGLDGRSGRLRRRLEELSGKRDAGVN